MYDCGNPLFLVTMQWRGPESQVVVVVCMCLRWTRCDLADTLRRSDDAQGFSGTMLQTYFVVVWLHL